MLNIDQLIVIFTLIVKSVIGQGWTSFKETCNIKNQIYVDDYEILSRDAESGLHCAIIGEFYNCRTCLVILSAKTCACIYKIDDATASDMTTSNDFKTIFSSGWDTAKYYVLNKSPPTGNCDYASYTWIPELQLCLRMITDKMTYSSAIFKCVSDGANVLMLKTRTKARSLYKYLVCNGYLSAYWLGFGDKQKEGVYMWMDNSPAPYIDWYPSEPSAGTGEDCVRIQYRAELGQYSWLDSECNLLYSVICEK